MDIGSRLQMARKKERMSMRDLAILAEVSPTAISKYENGKDVPRQSTLLRLAKALGVETDYFLRESTVKIVVPAYRKHSKLGKQDQEAVEATIMDVMERYLQIEAIRAAERRSDCGLPSYEIESPTEAEDAADALRSNWFLGAGPIDSICAALEDHGIKVVMLDGPDRFDGFCCWVNKTIPVIAYNGHLAGDRQRFTLAHELGHLVLRTEDEALAHRFAGAFLVPRRAVFEELGQKRSNLDIGELMLLKRKYGMSIQAWVMRAYHLHVINSATHQRIFRKISALGMRTHEQGEVLQEKPERMQLLIHQALAEDLISPSLAVALLGTGQRKEVEVLHEDLEKAANLLVDEYRHNSELTDFAEADLEDTPDDVQ